MEKKRKPRKQKREPGLARPTAAERRKQRSEANELRQQINPPEIVSQIKRNQRRREKIIKTSLTDTSVLIDLDVIASMNDQDKTNLALLRFVLPTLKAVELNMGEQTVEQFVMLLNADA